MSWIKKHYLPLTCTWANIFKCNPAQLQSWVVFCACVSIKLSDHTFVLHFLGSFPLFVLLLVHYPHMLFVIVFLGTPSLKSGNHKAVITHPHTSEIQTRALMFTPGMSHGRFSFQSPYNDLMFAVKTRTRVAQLLLSETRWNHVCCSFTSPLSVSCWPSLSGWT